MATGKTDRLPVHLCPWCKAHVAEHDLASLLKHSRKWRERLNAKG